MLAGLGFFYSFNVRVEGLSGVVVFLCYSKHKTSAAEASPSQTRLLGDF